MGIISIVAFKTEPGKLEEHLAITAGATQRLREMGLAIVPMQAMVGTDVGTISMVGNYASNADYVAAVGKIQSDAGWQQFYADAVKAQVAQQVESSLFSDLDASFQPDPSRPMGAILATQWRPRPGRLGEFLERVGEATPHTERMGGRTRVTQSVIGAHPLTILVGTAFEDLAGYGAYADTAASDGDWQQLWGAFMADPSADLIRSGIYLNISGD